MQIQIKQLEIIQAIKEYVNAIGINTTNKTFDVSFIVGRKENKISAEITIEDFQLDEVPLRTCTDTALEIIPVPEPLEVTNESMPDIKTIDEVVAIEEPQLAQSLYVSEIVLPVEIIEDKPKARTVSLFS